MQRQATEGLRSGDYIEYSKDALQQRKIENALEGIEWTYKHLFSELKEANQRTLAGFLIDMITHDNPRPKTKSTYIQSLVLLSRFYKHAKAFKKLTRNEVMTFLQSYLRTPAADPDEAWISTYNLKAITIMKFYKWLYFPNLTPAQCNDPDLEKPAVIKDIPLYQKKEKTSIEAKDLWLPAEDKIFLKYCPDTRLCLYHTMADDTSGRPHELLSKRYNDVKIKNHNGRTYGEVEIGRGGKTKGRTVPLIISVPYFKQMQGQNADPNAFIFRAFSHMAKHKNRPLAVTALDQIYSRMKEFFKTLLDRPDVPTEDKAIIRAMPQYQRDL